MRYEAMATQRVIKSVLSNFLGTYTSRYSDFNGYWLFGFLVSDLTELQIDLLLPTISDAFSPLEVAVRLAAAKFEQQVQKAGLTRSQVHEASLTIQKSFTAVDGSVNGHPCAGYNVTFAAAAVMVGGRRYEYQKIVFVAPHNADAEYRSARVV